METEQTRTIHIWVPGFGYIGASATGTDRTIKSERRAAERAATEMHLGDILSSLTGL